MAIFDLVWSLPSGQKKQAVQKELAKRLVGKVVEKVSLDPHPDTLGRFLHISFGDGTTLTVAEETVTATDGGPMDSFVIRLNGEIAAKL